MTVLHQVLVYINKHIPIDYITLAYYTLHTTDPTSNYPKQYFYNNMHNFINVMRKFCHANIGERRHHIKDTPLFHCLRSLKELQVDHLKSIYNRFAPQTQYAKEQRKREVHGLLEKP
jgi:hypothetical protein